MKSYFAAAAIAAATSAQWNGPLVSSPRWYYENQDKFDQIWICAGPCCGADTSANGYAVETYYGDKSWPLAADDNSIGQGPSQQTWGVTAYLDARVGQTTVEQRLGQKNLQGDGQLYCLNNDAQLTTTTQSLTYEDLGDGTLRLRASLSMAINDASTVFDLGEEASTMLCLISGTDTYDCMEGNLLLTSYVSGIYRLTGTRYTATGERTNATYTRVEDAQKEFEVCSAKLLDLISNADIARLNGTEGRRLQQTRVPDPTRECVEVQRTKTYNNIQGTTTKTWTEWDCTGSERYGYVAPSPQAQPAPASITQTGLVVPLSSVNLDDTNSVATPSGFTATATWDVQADVSAYSGQSTDAFIVNSVRGNFLTNNIQTRAVSNVQQIAWTAYDAVQAAGANFNPRDQNCAGEERQTGAASILASISALASAVALLAF